MFVSLQAWGSTWPGLLWEVLWSVPAKGLFSNITINLILDLEILDFFPSLELIASNFLCLDHLLSIFQGGCIF